MSVKTRQTKIQNPTSILLVTDLDGTASGSWKHVYLATQLTQKQFGLPLARSRQWYRKHYCPEKGHDALLDALSVKQKDKPEHRRVWFKHYTRIIRELPPKLVKGFIEEFEFLHSLDMSLYLLTGTSLENVANQLNMGWASKIFKGIYTTWDKTDILTKLKAQFPEKIIISLGDTLSDGRASLAAGVFFAAMIHEQSNNLESQLEEFVVQNEGHAVAVHGFEELESKLASLE